MPFTAEAILTSIHGIVLGGLFLLSYTGGLLGLYSLRSGWVTLTGFRRILQGVILAAWIIAIVPWLTVLMGTYVIFPAYQTKPEVYLKSHPQLAPWHEIGMAWKQHIAWMVPLLATAVAYVVLRYSHRVVNDSKIRRALIVLLSISFVAALIAAAIGALLNKLAPVQ